METLRIVTVRVHYHVDGEKRNAAARARYRVYPDIKAAARARHAHEEMCTYYVLLEVHASVSLGMVGRQLIGCYVALGSAEKIIKIIKSEVECT